MTAVHYHQGEVSLLTQAPLTTRTVTLLECIDKLQVDANANQAVSRDASSHLAASEDANANQTASEDANVNLGAASENANVKDVGFRKRG